MNDLKYYVDILNCPTAADNDSNITKYKIPPFKIQQSSTNKGKYVVATDDIPIGVVMHAEKPIVCLQALENKQDVMVCLCCKKHVGTIEQQMDLLAKRVSRQDFITLCNDSSDINNVTIPCKYNCGEIYCSTKCMNNDLRINGHLYQCTGPIDDTDHPLFRFKIHAMQTNEIFLLAFQVFSQIIQKFKNQMIQNKINNGTENINACVDVAKSPFKRFHANPWWEVVWPEDTSDLTEKDILASTIRELTLDSFTLLKKAVLCVEEEQNMKKRVNKTNNDNGDEIFQDVIITETIFDSLFDLEYYGRTIGMFEQNNLGVRKTSPIMKDIVRKQQEILSSCEHNKTTNVANDNYQDTEVVHPDIIKQIQTTLNEIEENGLWNEEVEDGSDNECHDDECHDHHTHTHTGTDTTVESSLTTAAAVHDTTQLNINNDDDESKGEVVGCDVATTSTNINEVVLSESTLEETVHLSITDLSAYFPPLDGTALFTIICCMNHSCNPNVEIQWHDDPKGPLVAKVTAIRPIKTGDELAFSYIDRNLSYEERQFKLRDYGFICECQKCKSDLLQLQKCKDS
jgi:hypothetical protein